MVLPHRTGGGDGFILGFRCPSWSGSSTCEPRPRLPHSLPILFLNPHTWYELRFPRYLANRLRSRSSRTIPTEVPFWVSLRAARLSISRDDTRKFASKRDSHEAEITLSLAQPLPRALFCYAALPGEGERIWTTISLTESLPFNSSTRISSGPNYSTWCRVSRNIRAGQNPPQRIRSWTLGEWKGVST